MLQQVITEDRSVPWLITEINKNGTGKVGTFIISDQQLNLTQAELVKAKQYQITKFENGSLHVGKYDSACQCIQQSYQRHWMCFICKSKPTKYGWASSDLFV